MSKKEKIALAAVATYLTIMMSGMYVMRHIYGINYNEPRMVTVLAYFQIIATGTSLLFYNKFFKGTAFKRPKINFWIVELLATAMVLAFLQTRFGDYTNKDMSLIYTIIFMFLLVGIGEEMVFRGIVFNAFRTNHGDYVAILVSAAIFGSLHITNVLGGEPLGEAIKQVGSAALTGILFAWVFTKTKNVVPTMIYHWVWDMFIVLGMYVPVTQTTIVLEFQNLFSLAASIGLLALIISKLVLLANAKRNHNNEVPAAPAQKQ